MSDDRITDLIFQSGITEHSYYNPNQKHVSGYIVSEEKLGKLIKMLVQECINEIHGADIGDLYGKSYYLDKVAEHIEKHFGV